MTAIMDLDETNAEDCTIETRYACPICKQIFLGKDAIKEHIKKYYQYICDFCKKSYFRERYLKRHRMNAHLESKRLKCPLCPKEFRAVYNLKQHLHLHSDEKSYICMFEGCNKRYRQRPGLQQHIRRIHKENMKLICPYCNEEVLLLSSHIRKQHKDVVEKVKTRESTGDYESVNLDASSVVFVTAGKRSCTNQQEESFEIKEKYKTVGTTMKIVNENEVFVKTSVKPGHLSTKNVKEELSSDMIEIIYEEELPLIPAEEESNNQYYEYFIEVESDEES